MLIATAGGGNEEFAIGASAVSCFIALGTGFFAYLTSRNKNQHEVEMKRIDADVQNLKEDLDSERALRVKLQADHSKCETDHNETKIKLASLQGRLAVVEGKMG